MDRPLVLPLDACTHASLVGGKALGLARLLAAEFAVPSGLCVTTLAYSRALESVGFSETDRWEAVQRLTGQARRQLLTESQAAIRNCRLEVLNHTIVEQLRRQGHSLNGTWAVRSSATNEDSASTSFAGIYRTVLGVSSDQLGQAIVDVWASIWDERVLAYYERTGFPPVPPAMAVVIQCMLMPRVAGVAYSLHPVTGRTDCVVINAVPGLASSLADGTATPDQYVVACNASPDAIRMIRRDPASTSISGAVMQDDEMYGLVRAVTQVEQAMKHPVDVEWAIDDQGIWFLQVRPITAVRPTEELTNDGCEWSRANFKETMPEVPSPIGCSFLEVFMDDYIIAHYRRLGCRIPSALSSVRILYGRPYLNLSLFHLLVGQMGGDTSLLTEQLGGESLDHPPVVKPIRGLGLARAAVMIFAEMRRAAKHGPRWFIEMKQLADTYRPDRIEPYSLDELAAHLEELGRWLRPREVTFGIAAGVGQCLQTFSQRLPRWLGKDWRTLLNAALQGQGTVISAQQIVRLSELVSMARGDEKVVRALVNGSDGRSYRERFQGTGFLASFDRYLEDYGHRGLGESDIMSPRFADRPDTLLDIISAQLRGPDMPPARILERQRAVCEQALGEIKRRCGWRIDRWLLFLWWYRRAGRFFSLREANRHHLMFYSTAVRNILLRFGARLVERGVFSEPEDVFFLTMQEQARVASGDKTNWSALVQGRRADWKQWNLVQVPDSIKNWEDTVRGNTADGLPGLDGVWRGTPISPGLVTGPARLIQSMEDWGRVRPGDILVASVLDPGMAPLFGIAAGMVVEMGGTLSHGAIIAREYGLPAVANVGPLLNQLEEGEILRLDAGLGTVERVDNSVGSLSHVKAPVGHG